MEKIDNKIIATKTRRYLKKGSYFVVKEQQKREPRTFQIEKGILHPNGLLTYVCSQLKTECSSVSCTYLVKL